MKTTSSFSKFAALTALGVCSFSLSSFIVGAIRTRAQPADATGANNPDDLSIEIVEQHRDRPARSRLKRVGASATIRRASIDANGKNVHVAAEAILRDPRPGTTFVWAVRVTDPDDGSVLFERVYDHQAFRLPPSGVMSPTFEDVLAVPLPRGLYTVEVFTYGIPPDIGLEALRIPRIAKDLKGAAGAGQVMLGD